VRLADRRGRQCDPHAEVARRSGGIPEEIEMTRRRCPRCPGYGIVAAATLLAAVILTACETVDPGAPVVPPDWAAAESTSAAS